MVFGTGAPCGKFGGGPVISVDSCTVPALLIPYRSSINPAKKSFFPKQTELTTGVLGGGGTVCWGSFQILDKFGDGRNRDRRKIDVLYRQTK